MKHQPASDNPDRDRIIAEFTELWARDQSILFGQTFLGVPTLQHPFDAWITQEIIWETRPDRVVECGSYAGGSALLWAAILQQTSQGRVVAVDHNDNTAEARKSPLWKRVDFIKGSTADEGTAALVWHCVEGSRTMVILDSCHTAEHVARELELYAPFVTPGCYLIVQDGHVSQVDPDHGPGPREATEAFLETHPEFEVDRSRERMLFTFNPSGFLRRV